MLKPRNVCPCGKVYKQFHGLKQHLAKGKCRPKQPVSPLEQAQSPSKPTEKTLINPNTQINNTPNQLVEMPVLTPEELQRLNTSHESQATKVNNQRKCIYCDKDYSKHNIKRHEEVYCKHRYKRLSQYKHLVRAGIPNIPEDTIKIMELYEQILTTHPDLLMNTNLSVVSGNDIFPQPPNNTNRVKKQQLVRLDEARKKQISVQLKDHIPNGGTTNFNVENFNQVNNTNNIQNNNIVNQNINIIINPVFKEDLSHITPERQMYIILQRKQAIKALYDSIYENLANHNIFISDRQGDNVKYLDEQHGINNGDAEDVIGDIAMAHLGHLDGFIETHKKAVPEHRKNDLQYLEAYLIDEANNQRTISQLMAKIECIHNTSKMLLDKYEKIKVGNFLTTNSVPSEQPIASTEAVLADSLEPSYTP